VLEDSTEVVVDTRSDCDDIGNDVGSCNREKGEIVTVTKIVRG
jgi:hypothetical protein